MKTLKTQNFAILFLLALSIITFSCKQNKGENTENTQTTENTSTNTHVDTHDQKSTAHSSEKHGHHWGYQGEGAPEKWKDLCQEYAPCGGNAQSPIDISSAVPDKNMGILKIDYKINNKLSAVNNGHSVQLNYLPGSFFTWNSIRYELKQLHFHTPSEHTFNGKASAMEIHFVHADTAGLIAVIGIRVNEGAENPFLAEVVRKLPTHENAESVIEMLIDPNKLLPTDKKYFYYSGSLTTPPCTEGVEWIVMSNPIEASKEQIQRLSQMMPPKNARPVQALNDRKIKSN